MTGMFYMDILYPYSIGRVGVFLLVRKRDLGRTLARREPEAT
jgi:hypothetical protein